MDYTRAHIEIFANFISFAFQEMNINYWFQSKRVLCNITRWMDEIEMMTFDFVFKNYSSESVVFVMEEWFIPYYSKITGLIIGLNDIFQNVNYKKMI